MTDVQEALATLRVCLARLVDYEYGDTALAGNDVAAAYEARLAALATLEQALTDKDAEIERCVKAEEGMALLIESRDNWQAAHFAERMKRVAAEDEVARLTAERDEARKDGNREIHRAVDAQLAAESELARLRDALREYASHQSWRCEYPGRYPWKPDCPCGLIATFTELGMTEDAEKWREWAVANDPDSRGEQT